MDRILQHERIRRLRRFDLRNMPKDLMRKIDKHLKQWNIGAGRDQAMYIELTKLIWCYACNMIYEAKSGFVFAYPEVVFRYELFDDIFGPGTGMPGLDLILEIFELEEIIKEAQSKRWDG